MTSVARFEDFDIQVGSRKGGKVKLTCPKCSDRRSNKRDKSLSVDIDKGVWHCHYCSWSGTIHVGERANAQAAKQYRRPVARPLTPLSDAAKEWFGKRGISEATIAKMKIGEGEHFIPQRGCKMNTIQFNYYLKGELINVKYRTGNKLFTLESGAELIPYNLDSIVGQKECIITEGEMDCLSFVEIGLPHCVSVPNGANSNLSYLDDFIDGWFEDKETIYIAVDTDAKGVQLRDELVRRFGSERCRVLTYGDECKDANELLVKGGPEALMASYKASKDVKVSGVFSLDDYEDELDTIYSEGLKKGLLIGLPNFDELCSFETRRLAVVTGIPGCLTGDTKVTLADGSHTTMEKIQVGDVVRTLGNDWSMTSAPVTYKWDSGVKDVYAMTLRNGSVVKATKDHKFLTFNGWKPLSDVKAGDFMLVDEWDCTHSYKADEDEAQANSKTPLTCGQWVKVSDISYVGKEMTYDIEVAATHNFITTCVTSNSGKSEFIDEMCIRLNLFHGMKAAFFSPENMPIALHATKLLEKLAGKKMQAKGDDDTCVTPIQYENAKEYYRTNFFHILPEEGEKWTITNILAKAKYLIRRNGIKLLVIDPYNRVESEQQSNETETQYISRFLDKLTQFAQQNDALIFLMAHPTKIKKDNGNGGIPTTYDIKGSSTFFDKADFSIIVHRERDKGDDNHTLVRVEKVKFRHLGAPGDSKFKYNFINGRYIPWQQGVHVDFRSHLEDFVQLKQRGALVIPGQSVPPPPQPYVGIPMQAVAMSESVPIEDGMPFAPVLDENLPF